MGDDKRERRIFWIIYNGMLLAAFVLLLPLMVYAVATKPKRKHTFRQRMGWWGQPRADACDHGAGKCLWVHALSVGEVLAAQPLVVRLRQLHPEFRICFTTSTFTGFQTAGRLFGTRQRIELAYFPYDWLGAVRRVASCINPSMVILTETDIWPNFLMEMHRRRVPVCLVNLRFSEGSWRNYRRFAWLARYLLGGFDKITVQHQLDLKRLISLGIDPGKISVTGNIKFDGMAPAPVENAAAQWKRNLNIPAGDRVLVAGSTHAGEEAHLLDVQGALTRSGLATVLVIAPRDPMRSHEIIASCQDLGLNADLMSVAAERATEAQPCPRVVVVDTIGVLKELYSAADVAFVGGSLVPCGGHNPLEPAVWGKPVLFGPDMRDFALISRLLLDAGAAQQVGSTPELLHAVRALLVDPRLAEEMGARGLEVIEKHKGSIDKTLECIGILKSNATMNQPWGQVVEPRC